MFKLVKYDLKAYYKDFIIMAGAIILLNLALCIKINKWPNEGILGINMAISFAAFVVVFIWNILVFSRDIYGDSGYLLFTTPKSGASIVGSKIVTSLIQCLIIGFIAIFTMFLWAELLKVTSGFVFYVRDIFDVMINEVHFKFMLFLLISAIVVYVTFLLTVYLSITLSKVAIKDRKFGKLGSFIIFVLLVVVQGKLEFIVEDIFPATFRMQMINNSGYIDINIASTIFVIVIACIMFYITAYLLENKLDL